MGMAASQGRLLALTARLHDVEFEAQSIQHAKLALADQEDAVYQRYLNALDATCITGIMWQGTTQATIPATFQNLCGGWENTLALGSGNKAYGLVNQQSGHLYVTKEVYEGYQNYQGKDSDAFALQMLGYSQSEIDAYVKHRDTKGTFYPLADTNGERASKGIVKVDPSLDAYTDTLTYYTKNPETGGYEECSDIAAYTKKDDQGNTVFDTEAFGTTELYAEIPEEDTTTTPDAVIVDVAAMNDKLKSSEGNYYKNTFVMIQECGGCEIMEDEYKNDSDWLTAMVEQGMVGIYILSDDATDVNGYKFEQTSTSSGGYLNDTAVSSIDSTELKKAEAEYNKDLKAINRKDTQYDLALEELETERTAITTELDSIRTVIDDNIDRTFGVFS